VTNIGFTGTRHGMTKPQQATLAGLLRDREGEFHHGDAIGADQEAAQLAYVYGYRVVPHRPTGHRSEDYLARNREIVNAVAELYAAPYGDQEELRSGTWATVRYARKAWLPVTIIWPDGTLGYD